MSRVVKVKRELIPEIDKALVRSNTARIPTTNSFEAFRFEVGSETIIGYTSGKIVANGEVSANLLSAIIVSLQPEVGGPLTVGSDEAGKGEWLGPLVVAAVAVTPRQSNVLVSKGVMDSKLMNPNDIRLVADFVRKECPNHRTVVIQPSRLNELLMDVRDEGKSLNDLLAWGHARAIKDVVDKLPVVSDRTKIVIDEFDKVKMERRLLRVINRSSFDVIQHPRAEEEPAVAAASILARDERESWIDSRSRQLNKNLRRVGPSEALLDPYAYSFAKITFLKQGRSGEDAEIGQFLQKFLSIEHMLLLMAESFGMKAGSATPREIVRILESRGLLTRQLGDELELILDTRNKLVHNRELREMELRDSLDSMRNVLDALRRLVSQKSSRTDSAR